MCRAWMASGRCGLRRAGGGSCRKNQSNGGVLRRQIPTGFSLELLDNAALKVTIASLVARPRGVEAFVGDHQIANPIYSQELPLMVLATRACTPDLKSPQGRLSICGITHRVRLKKSFARRIIH